METPERRQKQKTETEIRNEMRRDLAQTITNKVLRGLRGKIETGEKITNRDIAEFLRPIVDNDINFENRIFSTLVFEDLDDLYNEVVPLIETGIEKARERTSRDKPAA